MKAPLFVPGDRPERFAKAQAAGATAVILDLEDAVAPDRKTFARDAIRSALRDGVKAWVRVNVAPSDEGVADLQMLRDGPPPLMVMLPKVTGPRDLDAAREILPGIPFVVLIESLDGMRKIDEIAGAPNVAALALGGYDLCAELGARPTHEVLIPWRSRTVFAARIAGIDAIDTPFVDLDDDAGLAADARRAVDFGFDGKLAIHPKQIVPIKAAFEPTPSEVERARGILRAAAGGGVVRYGNTMIDAPLVAAAHRVLSRSQS
jgi:citrate lyase beta subunit